MCHFCQEKFATALNTGRIVELDKQFLNENDAERNFLLRIVPEKNEQGQVEYLLSVGLDITDRKKTEAELQRLDLLNLVGEMASAIGNEVRNPMTTVQGYLQLFQNKDKFFRLQGPA